MPGTLWRVFAYANDLVRGLALAHRSVRNEGQRSTWPHLGGDGYTAVPHRSMD